MLVSDSDLNNKVILCSLVKIYPVFYKCKKKKSSINCKNNKTIKVLSLNEINYVFLHLVHFSCFINKIKN